MIKQIIIKPSKFQSTICFVAGCIFCIAGIFIVIPKSVGFGCVWTLFAVLLTITNGINAFSMRGNVGIQTMETVESADMTEQHAARNSVEERLQSLKDLYDKQLITESEYTQKKKDILGEL